MPNRRGSPSARAKAIVSVIGIFSVRMSPSSGPSTTPIAISRTTFTRSHSRSSTVAVPTSSSTTGSPISTGADMPRYHSGHAEAAIAQSICALPPPKPEAPTPEASINVLALSSIWRSLPPFRTSTRPCCGPSSVSIRTAWGGSMPGLASPASPTKRIR